jgi:hypothetical protein
MAKRIILKIEETFAFSAFQKAHEELLEMKSFLEQTTCFLTLITSEFDFVISVEYGIYEAKHIHNETKG